MEPLQTIGGLISCQGDFSANKSQGRGADVKLYCLGVEAKARLVLTNKTTEMLPARQIFADRFTMRLRKRGMA